MNYLERERVGNAVFVDTGGSSNEYKIATSLAKCSFSTFKGILFCKEHDIDDHGINQ